MKNILKTIAVVFLTVLVTSCGKDYFDVNTPTSAVSADQLRMNDLLAPVIYHTIYAQYDAERIFGNYSQNFVYQGGGAAGTTTISGTWSNVYLYILPNLKTIFQKASAVNATHFDAIARILTAINIGLATDSYENIPYSQAAKASDNFTPGFDSQEAIYNDIFSLLDAAITELEAPDNSGYTIDDKTDLIYHGDVSKWLKAAYTLKARYALHLVNKLGAAQAAQKALDAIAKGFTSNDDDFQMFFDTKHLNPWYSREVLAKHTGNAHDVICDQLVSYMDGTSYPFTGGVVTMDPRLPVYAETDDGSDVYKGYVSGGYGVSGDGSQANTDFREEGYYTNATAPIVIISYSEALFIKAEAEFLANGGTTTSVGTTQAGYDAYLAGIAANMAKLGVNGTDYLADPSVAMGADNLKLEDIMWQKYIANFLNPETFVDLRRYNFSTDVFKDLSLPADNDQSDFPGEWLVRAQYPSTEVQRNPDNVADNQKSPVDPLWWMN
ncbi:SusD/RagB family nutrient-binding outer membrane lipoprotein [Candidatus Sulfidibacterium hydrothermale]|uniref:SusD/RagB family nutrient-binding outer membrane lipoprotein n=1 Tax=Candidatus Sulfidibacterium hydrothermale TaxID=2875962 RepID=UPI001F0AE31E|nr:SusD/RagB family nutrient-binding outer membrane lipoprotein [Candidatus Sulfidibacterium hydrothermale]UBM61983.1 SusD/RagB family nutrient-binding outer membrane lipoprotein [Candidatus Sulfidibacterium hydrothermale]